MNRFGLIDSKSGQLLSLMSVAQARLPEGTELVSFDPPLDLRTEMWDEALRQRVVRPPKVLGDVYNDALAEFRRRGAVLPAEVEAALKSVLVDVIGADRFYNAAFGWAKRDSASVGGTARAVAVLSESTPVKLSLRMRFINWILKLFGVRR